jgi:hypothetical protein
MTRYWPPPKTWALFCQRRLCREVGCPSKGRILFWCRELSRLWAQGHALDAIYPLVDAGRNLRPLWRTRAGFGFDFSRTSLGRDGGCGSEFSLHADSFLFVTSYNRPAATRCPRWLLVCSPNCQITRMGSRWQRTLAAWHFLRVW